MSRFRTRLTRKNSLFPPALRSVRNSRPAQGNAWQKCDFAALYYISFCQIGISVEQKTANVSQCVIAKIWLKRNYIRESYWRRWEKWEKRSERGRGSKTKSSGDLWRYAKNSQTKLQAKRCVNAPQAALTFAKRRFAAVWANISRALSSRSGLRVHFTFLPRQKHFTFARKICSHIARAYPRKNFTLKKYVIML